MSRSDEQSQERGPGWGLRDFLLIVLGGAAIYLAVAFFVVTDKQRIEKLIDDGVAAFQAEDLAGCTASLDDTCTLFGEGGQRRAVTREAIARVLEGFFVEFDEIRVEVDKRSVVVTDDAARTSFQVTLDMAARGVGQLPRFQVRGTLGLRRSEPKVWKVSRIELIEKRSGHL